MRLPAITQYLGAVENPGNQFKTLHDFRVERDAYGEAAIITGSNGVVFKIIHNNNLKGLKCYITRRRFTRQIYRYAARLDSDLLCPAELIEEEVFISDMNEGGSFYDVVLMEWLQGYTLEREIRRAALTFNVGKLRLLSETFDRTVLRMLDEEWTHGDLKPENIMVDKEGRFRLIDLDAMFIPEFDGKTAVEMGTRNYQHPGRFQMAFDKHIDDYSIALISISLRYLADHPEAYGKYNNGDNIILIPDDVVHGRSPLYREITAWAEARGGHNLVEMCRTLKKDSPRIEGLGRMVADMNY